MQDNHLRELYQDIIIEHSRHPRHYGVNAQANRKKCGHNPLCGDTLTVYVTETGGTIQDICFEGSGCAISLASASLMTEAVRDKSVAVVQSLFKQFKRLVSQEQLADEVLSNLGPLKLLAGVSHYPMRVKCATLAWHTLMSALASDSDNQVVSTE